MGTKAAAMPHWSGGALKQGPRAYGALELKSCSVGGSNARNESRAGVSSLARLEVPMVVGPVKDGKSRNILLQLLKVAYAVGVRRRVHFCRVRQGRFRQMVDAIDLQ
jgi:hypothetical protein